MRHLLNLVLWPLLHRTNLCAKCNRTPPLLPLPPHKHLHPLTCCPLELSLLHGPFPSTKCQGGTRSSNIQTLFLPTRVTSLAGVDNLATVSWPARAFLLLLLFHWFRSAPTLLHPPCLMGHQVSSGHAAQWLLCLQTLHLPPTPYIILFLLPQTLSHFGITLGI